MSIRTLLFLCGFFFVASAATPLTPVKKKVANRMRQMDTKVTELMADRVGFKKEMAAKELSDLNSKMLEAELAEEDKLTVYRARKIQRFFSQPFHVAEVFTGAPGKLVSLKETIRGFKGLLAGEYDHIPEQAFYMVGGIDEVIAKAEKL